MESESSSSAPPKYEEVILPCSTEQEQNNSATLQKEQSVNGESVQIQEAGENCENGPSTAPVQPEKVSSLESAILDSNGDPKKRCTYFEKYFGDLEYACEHQEDEDAGIQKECSEDESDSDDDTDDSDVDWARTEEGKKVLDKWHNYESDSDKGKKPNTDGEIEKDQLSGEESQDSLVDDRDLDEEWETTASEEGNSDNPEDESASEFEKRLLAAIPVPSQNPSTMELLNELRERYTFTHKNTLTAFIWAAEDSSTNPFIGRSVKFLVSRETLKVEDVILKEGINLVVPLPTDGFDNHLQYFKNYEKYCTLMRSQSREFWNSVGEFLAVFGEHIWELTITQEDCGLTPALLFKILSICLAHVPNLKKLVIEGTFSQILQKPVKRVAGQSGDQEEASKNRIPKSPWWHPSLLQRVKDLTKCFTCATLPQLLNLKMIDVSLKEHLPVITEGDDFFANQGYSLCNYLYLNLKHQGLVTSDMWSNYFPSVESVFINFSKFRQPHTDFGRDDQLKQFLPLLQTWTRNEAQELEYDEESKMTNPIPMEYRRFFSFYFGKRGPRFYQNCFRYF